MLRSFVIAALTVVGLFATERVAGVSEPLLIRSVILSGHSGPAYYSVIEQGYRFVGDRAKAPISVASSRGAVMPATSVRREIAISSLEQPHGGTLEQVSAMASAR